MKKSENKRKPSVAKQVLSFRSGNEMAADAGAHINFHVMGFYPITPSTEVAENLDAMKANGEHEIRMIAGDGEHATGPPSVEGAFSTSPPRRASCTPWSSFPRSRERGSRWC